MDRPLLIASDHAGFELKEKLKRALDGMQVLYRDLGVASPDPVDYPDLARKVAERVSRGVTCFDCHANGHTNRATHLAGDAQEKLQGQVIGGALPAP